MAQKAVTLMEMLVVIIIIGALASLGLMNYTKTREHALDKEATANIKLIQAAQKIYRMEFGKYANCYSNVTNGDTADETCINTSLRLSLSTANNKWEYRTGKTEATGTVAACVDSKRSEAGGRTFSLDVASSNEPQSATTCSYDYN